MEKYGVFTTEKRRDENASLGRRKIRDIIHHKKRGKYVIRPAFDAVLLGDEKAHASRWGFFGEHEIRVSFGAFFF